MGNTLKSIHSRKSQKFKHVEIVFKDFHKINTFAEDVHKSKEEKLRRTFEMPKKRFHMDEYPGLYFKYSYYTGNIDYVVEVLTKESFKGMEVPENNDSWRIKEDLFVNKKKKEDFNDYEYIEMACSNNYRFDEEKLKSTRYLLNMVPGHRNDLWKFSGKLVEELIKNYSAEKVWVCSGPLYVSLVDVDKDIPIQPKRMVEHELTKANEIFVPTHFFKAIVALKKGFRYRFICKIENDHLEINDHWKVNDPEHRIWKHAISDVDLSNFSGMQVFPIVNHPLHLMDLLNQNEDIEMIDTEEIESHVNQLESLTDQLSLHYDQMDSHKKQLTEHTKQLTSHTEQLNTHKQQLKSHIDQLEPKESIEI